MDPETAMEHWRLKRYISSHELAVALAEALDQRDQARRIAVTLAEQLDSVRSERDSLAAVLSVAQVAS